MILILVKFVYMHLYALIRFIIFMLVQSRGVVKKSTQKNPPGLF